MRQILGLFAALLALAACQKRTVSLSDLSCPTLKVGDRVDGMATLNAYRGEAYIHYGATLSRKGCPEKIGLILSRDELWADYRDVLSQLPPAPPLGSTDALPDFVEGDVIVSGKIVRDQTGEPDDLLLNAATIRIR